MQCNIRACRKAGASGRLFLLAFEQQPDQRYELFFLLGEKMIGREHHGLARAAHALERRGALLRALEHGVEIVFRVDVENRKLYSLDGREIPARDGKRDPSRE